MSEEDPIVGDLGNAVEHLRELLGHVLFSELLSLNLELHP